MDWYERSVFYRIRARCGAFFLLWSFLIQPSIFAITYVYLFVYPLALMTLGHPITVAPCYIVFIFWLVYTIYWIWDFQTPFKGGRYNLRFRRFWLFKWLADYFPAQLVASDELRQWADAAQDAESVQLPRDVNYLVGYHPHGPIAVGGAISFGNDCLRFSKLFPGIKPYMATLNLLHHIPIYRDYISLGGKHRHSLLNARQICHIPFCLTNMPFLAYKRCRHRRRIYMCP